MIVIEYLNNDTLVRHYSDKGYLLLQNETGVKYDEAIDVVPCRYTYTETDESVQYYVSVPVEEGYQII